MVTGKVYGELGLPKVINAVGAVTLLGGTLMPPEVIEAMVDAAGGFVDLIEFKARAGQKIAELTHNEAAHISAGAAAGLLVAVAACVAGTEPAAIDQLPRLDGLKDEVVVFRAQRNAFDQAIRQVGVSLREVGYTRGCEPWQLESAIGAQTAAVFFFAGSHYSRGALSLAQTIEIAHRAGVPVLVDAAAQLPPPENLWRFTQAGADLVVFSGGKALRGPQSTGFIVGRQGLIRACARNDSPQPSIGRPMKVGKEEIAGLVAAVQWFLAQDWQGQGVVWERQVASVVRALAELPGLQATRDFPGLAGQPIPRVRVAVDPLAANTTVAQIIASLRSGNPRIEVGPVEEDGFFVNPHTLAEGEEELVSAAIRRAVARG
jgi:uncharacterized pyridoxal phosphate-dependent enzyme